MVDVTPSAKVVHAASTIVIIIVGVAATTL